MAIRTITWSPAEGSDAANLLAFAASPFGSICGYREEWDRLLRSLGYHGPKLAFGPDPVGDPADEAARFVSSMIPDPKRNRQRRAVVLRADAKGIHLKTPASVELHIDIEGSPAGADGDAPSIRCRFVIDRGEAQMTFEVLAMLGIAIGFEFPVTWEDEEGVARTGNVLDAVAALQEAEARAKD